MLNIILFSWVDPRELLADLFFLENSVHCLDYSDDLS